MGARIKRRRKALGLSQIALARKARLSQGHLSLIESGARRQVSVPVVQRLATALNLSITELLESGPAPGSILIEVLPGGAVRSTVGRMSPKSHEDAEVFLAYMARLLGGETTRRRVSVRGRARGGARGRARRRSPNAEQRAEGEG